MAKKNISPTRVMLSNVRIDYEHIWTARPVNDSEPKYSLTAIISKEDSDLIKKIGDAIEVAVAMGAKKWGGKVPDNLKMPVHDGDSEHPDDEAFANAFYVNAYSEDRPQIVDRRVNPIDDPMDVYSGCYCNVMVTFFAYNVEDRQGIGAALGNIQKVTDGERLTHQTNAEDDFDPLDDDEAEEDVTDAGKTAKGSGGALARKEDLPDYM